MTECARVQAALGVSRETMDRLEIYVELLKKWNSSINLVSRSTISDVWTRHIVDSGMIFPIANRYPGRWVDFGSGAGFPGAVLAIMAEDVSSDIRITCIETDIRKCEFLRTVGRATQVSFGVLSRRIQDAPAQNAKVITARALADLSSLLSLASHHLADDGRAIFHKGAEWQKEVEVARSNWHFSLEAHNSKTQEGAVVLEIGDLKRA
jgi:16S rRNA (guanine527-N7)-methyltransferase